MKASEARAMAIDSAIAMQQTVSPSFDRITQLISEAVDKGEMSITVPMRSVKYTGWMQTILQADGYKCISGSDKWGSHLIIKW